MIKALALLFTASLAAEPLSLITKDGTSLTFEVELARTKAEHVQGLQGRTDLAPNAGMLFVFSPPESVAMWMFNTPIPLDIIFMNKTGTITHIFEDTTPYSQKNLGPIPETAWVLELNAGSAKEKGIQRGDRIQINGL